MKNKENKIKVTITEKNYQNIKSDKLPKHFIKMLFDGLFYLNGKPSINLYLPNNTDISTNALFDSALLAYRKFNKVYIKLKENINKASLTSSSYLKNPDKSEILNIPNILKDYPTFEMLYDLKVVNKTLKHINKLSLSEKILYRNYTVWLSNMETNRLVKAENSDIKYLIENVIFCYEPIEINSVVDIYNYYNDCINFKNPKTRKDFYLYNHYDFGKNSQDYSCVIVQALDENVANTIIEKVSSDKYLDAFGAKLSCEEVSTFKKCGIRITTDIDALISFTKKLTQHINTLIILDDEKQKEYLQKKLLEHSVVATVCTTDNLL